MAYYASSRRKCGVECKELYTRQCNSTEFLTQSIQIVIIPLSNLHDLDISQIQTIVPSSRGFSLVLVKLTKVQYLIPLFQPLTIFNLSHYEFKLTKNFKTIRIKWLKYQSICYVIFFVKWFNFRTIWNVMWRNYGHLEEELIFRSIRPANHPERNPCFLLAGVMRLVYDQNGDREKNIAFFRIF